MAVSQARSEERPASPVKVRAVERLQGTVAEEAERKPPAILKDQQEVVVLQSERNIEDAAPRETSYVPPGTSGLKGPVCKILK